MRPRTFDPGLAGVGDQGASAGISQRTRRILIIVVRASISKNHKQAMQPLTPDAVYALRELTLDDERPKDRIFKGLIPRMPRFRADLEAAGIPYIDAKGEYADFHSLRKTFGTMLTLAGVGQRTVMELMRHSDIRTTMNIYGDVVTDEMAQAHSKVVGLAMSPGGTD